MQVWLGCSFSSQLSLICVTIFHSFIGQEPLFLVDNRTMHFPCQSLSLSLSLSFSLCASTNLIFSRHQWKGEEEIKAFLSPPIERGSSQWQRRSVKVACVFVDSFIDFSSCSFFFVLFLVFLFQFFKISSVFLCFFFLFLFPSFPFLVKAGVTWM